MTITKTKRGLTLTLSKRRGNSGIAECSQLSHTECAEPLGRWPVGEKQYASRFALASLPDGDIQTK